MIPRFFQTVNKKVVFNRKNLFTIGILKGRLGLM